MERASRRGRPAGAALAFLLLLAAAGDAAAHGGQFRAPGAPPTGPGLGPAPVPTAITPGETWQTWWDLNRLGLLPGRDEALRREAITPREGEALDGAALREGWSSRRMLAAREQVLPFLLGVLDPRAPVRDELRAAALIALGKTHNDASARALLVHALHDATLDPLVRESAALGIGLLRRSLPAAQVEGAVLDGLRDTLLRAIDDTRAHVRVRAFAALALGLLGDQPWGSAWTKDGRLVVRGLWSRLGGGAQDVDLPVALLTALGLQPPAGVPEAVREGLRELALGKAVLDRRWTPLERSHALTALARLGPPGVDALLVRVLERRGEPIETRRAAWIGIGRRALVVDGPGRVDLALTVVRGLQDPRDPLTKGLALVAGGRLLGADLEAGAVEVLEATPIEDLLLDAALSGTAGERGFGTIAACLAARGARASGHARPFVGRVEALLVKGLERGRGDDTVRAAYAVGLGLLEVSGGVDPLLDAVRDDGALPVLRGHAAVALGQIGLRAAEVRPVLRRLLEERADLLLRVRAAAGLALLGDAAVGEALVAELASADTEYHRAHAVLALGRLGDLRTIPTLLAYAADERRSDLARALAVVALGLLVDPEPVPSLARLSVDANFPSATQVLYSAFAIF